MRLTVRDDAGAIEVAAEVDSAAFGAPAASTVGRLVPVPPLRPGRRRAVNVRRRGLGRVGRPGARTQCRDVTVDDGGLRLLRPATAPTSAFPARPGPAAAAVDQVVGDALPFLLNNLAEQTGNDLAGQAGQLVAVIGDVLGSRDATPEFLRGTARLCDDRLRVAGGLQRPVAAALFMLAPLLDSVVPAGVSAGGDDGRAADHRGAVAASGSRPRCASRSRRPPPPCRIGRADASIALTESGIDAIAATVGPVRSGGTGRDLTLITVGAGANLPVGRVVASVST